jgi:hypothetical protein
LENSIVLLKAVWYISPFTNFMIFLWCKGVVTLSSNKHIMGPFEYLDSSFWWDNSWVGPLPGFFCQFEFPGFRNGPTRLSANQNQPFHQQNTPHL